jgi:hypothetical protein
MIFLDWSRKILRMWSQGLSRVTNVLVLEWQC